MNWTEIILGLFTLLSTCGWFVAGRKYRQEVEGIKADNRMKDMELGNGFVSKVDFVDLRRDSAMSESELSPLRSLLRQFRSNIARPLQEEVKD